MTAGSFNLVGWIPVVALLIGCGQESPVERLPQPPLRQVSFARVPIQDRQQNYYRGGSCVYASMITMFRYHGFHKEANWVRKYDRGGGVVIEDVSRRCRQFGIGYEYTTGRNVEFLESVSRTRRVAILSLSKGHAVNFVGFKNGKAIIIDNNNPKRSYTIPKREFYRRWKGYAIALTELPPPPKPWR